MNFTMDNNTLYAIVAVAIVLGIVIMGVVKVFNHAPDDDDDYEGEDVPGVPMDPLAQQIRAIGNLNITSSSKADLVDKLLDGRPRPQGEE